MKKPEPRPATQPTKNWSRDAIDELLAELRALAKTRPESPEFFFYTGKVLGTAHKHGLL